MWPFRKKNPAADVGTSAGTSACSPVGTSAQEAAALMNALPGQAEAVLKRLEWTTLKRLDGWLQGDFRTLMRGHGIDLADLREYQTHDDVRHIDWNVTARMGVPHVRVYTEDRDLTAWFALDLTGSLAFGSSGTSKHDMLRDFVAVLARVLTRHGNRVGAVIYRGPHVPLQVLPPHSGRLQVLQLLHAVMQPPTPAPRPSGKANKQAAPDTPTDLSLLLHRVQAQTKRRCAMFVLSDFISAPGWAAPLGQMALRHDVLAVRLSDPLEHTLPDIGIVPMTDAETGDELLVDTSSTRFRQRFEALAAQREAAIAMQLSDAGVDALELSTADDLAAAVVRMMDLRQRRPTRAGLPASRKTAPDTRTAAGAATIAA
jgi:uncharacterized protein (DUF58 family)